MVQWYIFAKAKGAKSFTFVARASTKKSKKEKLKEYRDKGYEVKAIPMSKAERRKIGKLPKRWRGAKPPTKKTLFLRSKTEKELGRRG